MNEKNLVVRNHDRIHKPAYHSAKAKGQIQTYGFSYNLIILLKDNTPILQQEVPTNVSL